MVNDRQQIVSLIVDKVAEIDPPALSERAVSLSDQTVLFGKEGLFDSLGLVALIVDVEQSLADATGVSITLGDDRAMSQSHSPFRTIGALADYARLLIDEHGGN
jgi:acyl carrier protein